MHERAAAAGGSFSAGPRRGGGWRVSATIPFHPASGHQRRDQHTGVVIRLVLVDDQAMVRQGLRMILESGPGLTVVGEAADGSEGVEVAAGPGPTSC